MSSNVRVMVLEDEAFVSSLIEMMLEDYGWTIDGAFRTNRAAVDYLQTSRPHVALIDFNIADGTSNPTAVRLRDLGIPFVVVSGFPRAMAKGNELEAAAWLDKPFSETKVIQSLQAAMASAGGM